MVTLMLRVLSRLSRVKSKKILFPEIDNRVLLGAKKAENSGFARPVFVANNRNEIEKVLNSDQYDFYQSDGDVTERINTGHTMLSDGIVDGMVSGCTVSTSTVIRSAIKYVGLERKTLSSFFIMEKNQKLLFLSDCAVVIRPNSEQLSNIALDTAHSFRRIMDEEPSVAILSFSSKGSAEDESINVIRNAVKSSRASDDQLHIDGELQLDAAVDMDISSKKVTLSRLNRPANVLIFPDLTSGNIGYKLLQHLGGWRATGPILQGLKKPSNDLSRGCSADDVFNVTALTCTQ